MYIWVKISELTTPKNNHLTWVNYYWIANDQDEVVLWQSRHGSYFPFASPNESIMARQVDRCGGARTVLLPVVYLPWQPSDYCD